MQIRSPDSSAHRVWRQSRCEDGKIEASVIADPNASFATVSCCVIFKYLDVQVCSLETSLGQGAPLMSQLDDAGIDKGQFQPTRRREI
jgi:hypothetical protein